MFNFFRRKDKPAVTQSVTQPAQPPEITQKYSKALEMVYLNLGGLSTIQPIRNYTALANEAYHNAVISFCIDSIADDCCMLPLEASVGGKNFEPLDEISVQKEFYLLAAILNPTKLYPRAWQEGRSIRDYLLYGVCYEHAVMTGRGLAELWPIPAPRVSIIEGKYGFPKGFNISYEGGHTSAGGIIGDFKADEVTGKSNIFFLRNYHPNKLNEAVAIAQKAYREVNTINKISELNYNMAKNGAVPSGLLTTTDNRNIGGTAGQRLRQELTERFSGAANAGKPLLGDNIDWKPMAISSREGEFRETRYDIIREILGVYRIPAQLYNVPDAQTYSNLAEARLGYYLRAIAPLAAAYWATKSRWISNLLGKEIIVRPDESKMPVMNHWLMQRMQVTDKIQFLTLNEKRELYGYENVKGGDELILPAGLTPLDDILNPPELPDEGGADEDAAAADDKAKTPKPTPPAPAGDKTPKK